MNLAIFKNLANPTRLFVALGSAVLFFDLSYFAMSKLPGTRDLMCVVGAGLTLGNILFSLSLSLLFGIMIAGVMGLYKKNKGKLAASSVSGIGLVFGILTIFCTACTIPVFTVLGAAISLHFFTTYQLFFQILSTVLMFVGLYLINKQLADECQICKI